MIRAFFGFNTFTKLKLIIIKVFYLMDNEIRNIVLFEEHYMEKDQDQLVHHMVSHFGMDDKMDEFHSQELHQSLQ